MALTIQCLGKNYTIDEFVDPNRVELPKWTKSATDFLRIWHQGDKNFIQKTSGSTGNAKDITITRLQMEKSALNTINALNIPKEAKVLHCINSEFIGGKMLWVRAYLGEWKVHLIPPQRSLEINELWEYYDFTAMVPLQVSKALDDVPSLFDGIKQLIIGGAAVNDLMIERLQSVKAICYATFGMTETISHIALRQLNGEHKSTSYKLIGDNKIRPNSSGCLEVKGIVTNNEWIETNDLIDLTPNGFTWIGRIDLVVNSGGVKISIEEIEAILVNTLRFKQNQFFLWKVPDSQLGEKLIGVSESEELINEIEKYYKAYVRQVPKYSFPKKWFLTDQILTTSSGKIDRISTTKKLGLEFNFS